MDTGLVIALSSAVVCGITIITFWMRFSDRITKAQATSDSALQVAAEAEKDVKEANERMTLLSSQFGLYREASIEKFVTHNAITELEKRLVESMARSDQRFADAMEGLNKRLDRLIEAGLGKHRQT